ncbi:MAG TPA: PLD nuclease N-terminal domain-containing protein [Streptosporangiaceae bacterium]|jgi:hypothetical protein
MALLGGILTLLTLGVWLYGLFDVLTTPDDECRGMPKLLWIVVVALFFLVGALAWFLLGRPRARVSGGTPSGWSGLGAAAPPPPARPRADPPRGPDDDPDFLKDLDRRMRGDD